MTTGDAAAEANWVAANNDCFTTVLTAGVGRCTTSDYRRIARWEHEGVLEAMQRRLDRQPNAMKLRWQTVEHPFGTLKAWMGATHFLTKRLPRVSAEMSLHVLAYDLKRVVQVVGIAPLVQAMRA